MAFVALSFDQLTCPGNSSVSDLGCNCLSTFYENAGACFPCGSYCDICINSTLCTTCTASTFRIVSGGLCICGPGYYDRHTLDGICGICPPLCTTCSSATNCTSCISNSVMNNANCVPIFPLSISLTKHSVNFNNLTINIQFNTPVTIVGELNSCARVTINDRPVSTFQTDILNTTSVFISLLIDESAPNVSVMIPSTSVLSNQGASLQPLRTWATFSMEYYYSANEVNLLKWVEKVIHYLSLAVGYGQLGFGFVGALAILANLINFIQLASFYAFLLMDFPFNLQFVLR